MSDISKLEKFINKKPFIYYKVPEDDLEDFYSFPYVGDVFSFTVKKTLARKFYSQRLIIIDTGEEIYIGYFFRKKNASSTEKSIHIKAIKKLQSNKITKTLSALNNREKKELKEKISSSPAIFSKTLSRNLLTHLWDKNSDILVNMISTLQKRKSNGAWLQYDAIKFALSISDIDRTFDVESVETGSEEYSEFHNIVRLEEDKVINFEASRMNGLEPKFSPSGKVIYTSKYRNEKVSIYTANKNKLEEITGADLIYVNHIQKNMVMVQYKMLNKEQDSWIYRPDQQLDKEIERMDKIAKILQDKPNDEYRLNSTPFYLRFIYVLSNAV